MNRRIGLVHATLAAVQPMVGAFRKHAPDVALLHFLDEGLLPLVKRDGLTPATIAEIERLVIRAVDSGVQGVLLTCSAYSPAVPVMRERCPVPVVSVDEAMLCRALGHGDRIGIVATVAEAGPTSAAFLRDSAAKAGRALDLSVSIVSEAFDALSRGDGARHDELVRERIAGLIPGCDAVVLAQISMARALDGAPAYPKPVLTSPETAARAILQELQSGATAVSS